MRARNLTLAVAALALLAACSGGGGDDDAAAPTTTAKPASTTTADTGPIVPLTGTPGTGPDRAALVVKIDNAPKARPPVGINQADLVVEEAVEGGITRLFTVFHSQEPGAIGPIRSARSTDVGLVVPLDHPLFAFSGASPEFLKLIRAAQLVDIGYDVQSRLYRREKGRPAPYNLFSTSQQLWSVPATGRPKPMFSYGEAMPGAKPAKGLHLEFRGKVQTIVDYAWRDDGGWARTQDGTPHVDGSGTQIAPPNVVVQVVEYKDTGMTDRSNTLVPEAVLVGGGKAMLLRDGTVTEGTWKREAIDKPTVFAAADGTPFRLNPGQTWVELARTDQFGTVAVR